LKEGATIKVKVYAPAFVNHDPLGADGTISLEDGATLNNLYRRLHLPIPLRLSFFCSVNYERAKWNKKLKDGDTVTFLFPISGG
jgi:molybdopterin converting factor small subunit